jgi:hypothetical protein
MIKGQKTRNLKSQAPNPKQYQSPKYQCSKQFRALNFDIWIFLELGFWNLGFEAERLWDWAFSQWGLPRFARNDTEKRRLCSRSLLTVL